MPSNVAPRGLRSLVGKARRVFRDPTLPSQIDTQALLTREAVERVLARIDQLEATLIDSRQHIAVLREEVAAVRGELAGRKVEAPPAAPKVDSKAIVDAIMRAEPNTFFDCTFNGVRAKIPQATLRTMTHCVHADPHGGFSVAVETDHMNWLRSRLRPGDTFLDIGAATGAMTVPVALGVPGVKIVAFEPARTARRLLIETVKTNAIAGVEVHGVAVSDQPGTVQFSELKQDEHGTAPFLPEASAITTASIDPINVAETYDVPVTSLDVLFAGRSDGHTVKSVKIDVEGFEIHVVRGATKFLAATKPHLAIDIHRDPFADGTTEAGVRAVLAPLGYTFEKTSHVLLCTPNAA
jgi:FkbM family methyltransferase